MVYYLTNPKLVQKDMESILRNQGARLWNSLPSHMKTFVTVEDFCYHLAKWNRPACIMIVDTVCRVNCPKSDILINWTIGYNACFMSISNRIELAFINQWFSDDAADMTCVCFIHIYIWCYSCLWRQHVTLYIFPSHLYIVIYISFRSSTSSLSPKSLWLVFIVN